MVGIVFEKDFFEDIDLRMEENFEKFIVFRCECTEDVERFIRKAKADGKKVYFDKDGKRKEAENTNANHRDH